MHVIRAAEGADNPVRLRGAPRRALRPTCAHQPVWAVRVHEARPRQGPDAVRVRSRYVLQRAWILPSRRTGARRGIPLVGRRGARAPPAVARNVRTTRAPRAPRPRRPPRQPSARAADLREFVARSDSAHSAGCLATYQATIMGPIFMSWTLFQIAWIAIGGERGVDNYVHHVLFLLVSIVAPYYSVCGELVLFSIAMEAEIPLSAPMPPRPTPTRASPRAACAADEHARTQRDARVPPARAMADRGHRWPQSLRPPLRRLPAGPPRPRTRPL